MSMTWTEENDGIGAKVPSKPPTIGLWATHAPTSIKAFEAVQPRIGSQKHYLLMAIRASGSQGETRRELAGTCSYLRDSVNGRCRELLDANLVHETGAERHGEHVIFAGPKPMTKP